MNDNSTILRAIGQDLESEELTDFELVLDAGSYRVTATVLRHPEPEIQEAATSFAGLWKRLSGGDSAPPPQPQEVEFHRCYEPPELEGLVQAGTRRRESSQSQPEDYSPSHILRVVGSYLDQKGASLVRLEKKRRQLILEYETAQGKREVEDRPYSSLYDFSTHLRRQRDESE